MIDTRKVSKEVQDMIAGQIRRSQRQVRKGQHSVHQVVRTWLGTAQSTAQSVRPQLPELHRPRPAEMPGRDQLVAGARELAEQVWAAQRRLTGQLRQATEPLAGQLRRSGGQVRQAAEPLAGELRRAAVPLAEELRRAARAGGFGPARDSTPDTGTSTAKAGTKTSTVKSGPAKTRSAKTSPAKTSPAKTGPAKTGTAKNAAKPAAAKAGKSAKAGPAGRPGNGEN